MRGRSWIFCASMCLLCVLLSFLPVAAIVNSYVEDFTSRQWCNRFMTTAWWDTIGGELKLHPFDPALVGSYDTPSDSAYGVAVSGDYAYVGDYACGLQVLNITDTADPILAGCYDTPGYAQNVAISGNRAYVADWASGLQVIDIGDPANPAPVGSCLTGRARCAAISGDYAYVSNLRCLSVIDINDPANPVLAGECDMPGHGQFVAVSGDYAYVADAHCGLQVINISNPTNPTYAGCYDTPDVARGLVVSGDYVYVGDGASGLQIIDVTDPTNPAYAGSYDTPGIARRVAVSGDYVYVADHTQGLHVVDVSDPENPAYAGDCRTYSNAHGVAVSGDYACVVDWAYGFHVIDIADPVLPPMFAGSCDACENASGVAISGDYAYVGDGSSGLQVIDITDPTNPIYAGGYDTPDVAHGVTIWGDYACVGDGSSGLQVIDITDPVNPIYAGSYDTPGDAHGVAVWGNYAYVGDGSSGLQVIDITDPTNPAHAGSYDTPDLARGVAISGDYAYVGDGTSGLQVIDITDPTNPTYAGSYDTPDLAHGVAISGDYAYVGDGTSGLQVIEVFQRRFDTQNNIAQSRIICHSDQVIVRARLMTSQVDSICWELSANGGLDWQAVGPDGGWHAFSAPGNDLLWRSSHCYAERGINPACTHMEIEWLYGLPIIDSIVDIPDDQGGQVEITWETSGYDYLGSPTPITEYAIFRRTDPVPGRSVATLGGKCTGAQAWMLIGDGHEFVNHPSGDWDSVRAVPATCEDSYSTVVPTLADSSISEGMYFTAFFIRARTLTPGIHFDSPCDSGYSVDNLAPVPPVNLRMSSATELAWDEAPEQDIDYFSAYWSDVPDFDETAVLIGYTTETVMDVSEDIHHYYHVTATDSAGNKGEASSIENAYTGVKQLEGLPIAYALGQNRPNPFEASTAIVFDLPEAGVVRLRVFDVGGRLLKSLTDGMYPAGRHFAVWRGDDETGRLARSGLYFVRLEAGSFVNTKKMTLAR